MNLVGEQFVPNKPDKSKKLRTIILVLIILLIIGIISVVTILMLLKEEKMVVTLDGKSNNNLKSILRIEEDNKIYIPIRDIATLFEYESYNGDYINRSEDTNQCYVETDEEVAAFKVGSDKIEKFDNNTKQVTYFHIDEPVQMIDGKLYTTPDGIEKAYNVNFKVSENNKKIVVETMKYLVEQYTSPLIEAGFSEVSTKFNDEKAILNDLVIVKDNKNQYGIFSIEENKLVLETKYSEISYIPISGDFLVKVDNKIGIKTNTGKDKIKVQYDQIELINQDLKMYVVQKDKKYGVINQNEKVIIPINYEEIGVDIKSFPKNDLSNKYVVLDKIIPVKKDGLWGMYDIEGNKILDCEFDKFGSTSSKAKNAESILVIPDYNAIVVNKKGKYYLVDINGKALLNGIALEDVYMTTELDKTNYYVIKDEKTYDAISLLEKLNSNSKSENTEDKENKENEKNKENND